MFLPGFCFLLYGDVNPSGKFPFVVPYQESVLPYVDWEAEEQYYEYYHGYTRLEKNGIKPLIPYGFGLSYTTFEIAQPSVTTDGEQLIVKTAVTNTGHTDGAEVVQLYVGFQSSKTDRPIKQLRGFQRVHVKAGETQEVTITTPLEKLKWYNPTYRRWELEKMEYPIYVGTSADPNDLKTVSITL